MVSLNYGRALHLFPPPSRLLSLPQILELHVSLVIGSLIGGSHEDCEVNRPHTHSRYRLSLSHTPTHTHHRLSLTHTVQTHTHTHAHTCAHLCIVGSFTSTTVWKAGEGTRMRDEQTFYKQTVST